MTDSRNPAASSPAARSPAATGPTHVYFGPRKIDVWPGALRVYDAGAPEDNVKIIPNPDIHEIQRPLVDAILEKEAHERAEAPRQSRANGGQRIRHLDAFGVAAFTLLNERAMELFRRVTGSPTAVVDDCWANVFRDGEYTLPHAHRRATASVVYALEPGDVTGPECDPMNGALILCDPRLKSCCNLEANRVTRPFRPTGIDAAVMVIFPGAITHAVCPYYGERPRISIAWNINAEAIPGPPPH